MDRRRSPRTIAPARRARVSWRDPSLEPEAGGRMSAAVEEQSSAPRRRLVVLLPLVVFLALAGLFFVRLGSDPSKIPSALIGHPAPAVNLPPVAGLERDG